MRLGLGLGLGFSSTRPRVSSDEQDQLRRIAEEALTRARATRLGEIIEPQNVDLLSEDALRELRLPLGFRQRIVEVGSIPFRHIQALLRDPRLLHTVAPRKFEEIIAELLAADGFSDVLLTPSSGDGGKDIVAAKEINGHPTSFYFECKRFNPEREVGLIHVRALLGVVAHDTPGVDVGVLVTTASFAPGARKLIADEYRLDGKDYESVVAWMRGVWSK